MFTKKNFLTSIEDPEDKENININITKEENQINQKAKITVYKKPIFQVIKESPILNVSKLSNSFQNLNILTSKESKRIKKEKLITSLNEYYQKIESKKIFCYFAQEIEELNKYIDKNTLKIPPNFLQRHEISKEIRMKMIDWMVEVLNIFKCSEETFFLSVNILDLYIYKNKSILLNEDIHLIGLISMFIASKFEDIYSIPLNELEITIGHNKFNKDILKKKEIQVLKTIKFENIFNTSVYDFLKIYLFDFYTCNKSKIQGSEKIYYQIKETCYFLGKLCLYSDTFYCVNNTMKALCCINVSIRMVYYFSNEHLEDDLKKFYNDWVKILIEKNNVNIERLNEFSKFLYEMYINYSKIEIKNLEKFCKLSYMK